MGKLMIDDMKICLKAILKLENKVKVNTIAELHDIIRKLIDDQKLTRCNQLKDEKKII
jgi:hypothetical protein